MSSRGRRGGGRGPVRRAARPYDDEEAAASRAPACCRPSCSIARGHLVLGSYSAPVKRVVRVFAPLRSAVGPGGHAPPRRACSSWPSRCGCQAPAAPSGRCSAPRSPPAMPATRLDGRHPAGRPRRERGGGCRGRRARRPLPVAARRPLSRTEALSHGLSASARVNRGCNSRATVVQQRAFDGTSILVTIMRQTGEGDARGP